MTKFFAGIGSRSTPTEQVSVIDTICCMAVNCYFTLRSGAAPGADTFFEQAYDKYRGQKEILLPWKGFNGNSSPLHEYNPEAAKIAAEIHPTWKSLKPAAKQLVARNMQQILGEDLKSPVKCVIAWTPDGCESIETYGRKTGGTGTAIALASSLDIPIFNLKNPFREIYAIEFLQSN